MSNIDGGMDSEIDRLRSQLASARKALEAALPIVADRSAGGRMLTSKEQASAAFELIQSALALGIRALKRPSVSSTEGK